MTHKIDVSSERFYFDVSIDRLKAFPDNSNDELWKLGSECSNLVEAFEYLSSALFDYERAELDLVGFNKSMTAIAADHLASAEGGINLELDEMIYIRTGTCARTPWRVRSLREMALTFSLTMFGIEVNRMAEVIRDDDFSRLRGEFLGRFPELKEVRDFFAHRDERIRREVRRNPVDIDNIISISSHGAIEITNSKGGQSKLEFDRGSIIFARDITVCAMRKCGYEFTG